MRGGADAARRSAPEGGVSSAPPPHLKGDGRTFLTPPWRGRPGVPAGHAGSSRSRHGRARNGRGASRADPVRSWCLIPDPDLRRQLSQTWGPGSCCRWQAQPADHRRGQRSAVPRPSPTHTAQAAPPEGGAALVRVANGEGRGASGNSCGDSAARSAQAPE